MAIYNIYYRRKYIMYTNSLSHNIHEDILVFGGTGATIYHTYNSTKSSGTHMLAATVSSKLGIICM